MKKAIALAWTRDFTLTWAEWWSRDMNPRIREVFGQGIPNQLSYYNGRLLETYRLVDESAGFIKAVVDRSLHSSVLSPQAIRRYVLLNRKIRKILADNRKDLANRSVFNKIMEAAAEMYPWYTACYLLPQEPWVNQLIEKRPTDSTAIVKRLVRARELSEGLIEELIEYWRAVAQILLKARNISAIYSSFVTFSELEAMLLDDDYRLDRKQLAKRAKQYIFFRGIVYTGVSRQAFFRKHILNYAVEPINISKEIKGTVSSPGPSTIKGTVSLILRNDEVRNFKSGNILVTIMTNPFFIPIMKQAKVIVTDEGGVTCHAAIVARELKKPCIIGTKIATKVLKDGDRVEVDATKGIVRKL